MASRTPIVFGNWKLNKRVSEAVERVGSRAGSVPNRLSGEDFVSNGTIIGQFDFGAGQQDPQ